VRMRIQVPCLQVTDGRCYLPILIGQDQPSTADIDGSVLPCHGILDNLHTALASRPHKCSVYGFVPTSSGFLGLLTLDLK
jgi:hypothetical protein